VACIVDDERARVVRRLLARRRFRRFGWNHESGPKNLDDGLVEGLGAELAHQAIDAGLERVLADPEGGPQRTPRSTLNRHHENLCLMSEQLTAKNSVSKREVDSGVGGEITLDRGQLICGPAFACEPSLDY
jgi:hypothetical protein